MPETYDGILLGSGHNSLILQAYAGRAGLETICLEQASQPGGGLTTEELPQGSGFRHNTHAFFHRGLDQLPWYHDLGLRGHGAEYVQPDLNVALICRDGQSLQWWTDFERTVESFRRFDEQDAETLVRWRRSFKPIVEQILVPEAQSPPLPPEERTRLLSGSSLGRQLLEVSELSPLEFVRREFRHPVVQAGLLFFNGLREVDLREPGFGHHIPQLLAADAFAQLCLGGSRQLARALVAAVEEAGGKIQCESRPARILVEGGRAVGVETDGGRQIRARHFIASGLNPQQTFLELFDDADIPAEWRQFAGDYRYNLLAPLFGTYLNLKAPVRYAAAADCPELDQALMVILGLERSEQFLEIVQHHEKGTIPPTVMWGSCPTRFDPQQAPEGRHAAFMWEKLPYELAGDADRWDQEKDRHGEQMIETWKEYAPSLQDDLLDVTTRSPLDTARRLPNMRFGDLLVGALTRRQMGFHRPFPGAGHYRGHLPGMYLCGSSCHPGGNITGMPGYNSAQVLLADLGIKADWTPDALRKRLPAAD
ncbi:MAG: NAD(P)/FAD-dependent oxidoreductase [Pirellulaceae bacterium]